MPQLGDDDDLLLSTRPFNMTRHVLGTEPPQVKNMKPCLISFDIFRLPLGVWLIHQRLSVCLSLYTNDMQKTCSNICFMLKPNSVLPIKGQPSASPPQTTTRATT